MKHSGSFTTGLNQGSIRGGMSMEKDRNREGFERKSGQEYLEYLPERGWTPYAEMLQNIKGVYDRMVKNGFGSEEEIRTAIAKRLGRLVFFVDQCLCHAEYLTHEAFEKLSSQRMESDFFLEIQKFKRTLTNKLIANGFSEKKITGRISELGSHHEG